MACYQNMINELVEMIRENGLPYESTIVIGDNSSGKSELLKRLLLEEGPESWYLIDSVNRGFTAGQIFKMEGEAAKLQFSKKITEHRLREDNYNLKDTFYYMGVPTPMFSFVVTTHSADLIAGAKEANLVLLSDGAYELLDAGDFNSVSQVYNVFNSVFRESSIIDKKEQIDSCLRRLLNNKAAGIWNEENQRELTEIKNMSPTKLQKVLIKQIEEW